MSPSAQSTGLQSLLHPHLQLLDNGADKPQAVGDFPIFTHHVEETLPKSEIPTQYGLLGSNISRLEDSPSHSIGGVEQLRTRLFYNVAAPTSTFICGSQGSGKSHTLSTLLENCLIPSEANRLLHPLAGLVFHYDTFISDTGGMPCEAAYLSSHPAVQVKVLCAPSNIRHIQVSPLLIIKRLFWLTLEACLRTPSSRDCEGAADQPVRLKHTKNARSHGRELNPRRRDATLSARRQPHSA
jgi:hypothetical protein